MCVGEGVYECVCGGEVCVVGGRGCMSVCVVGGRGVYECVCGGRRGVGV